MATCCLSFYKKPCSNQTSQRTAPFKKKKNTLDFYEYDLNLGNKNTIKTFYFLRNPCKTSSAQLHEELQVPLCRVHCNISFLCLKLLSTVWIEWKSLALILPLFLWTLHTFMVGQFHVCEKEEFLEPWKEHYFTVTKHVQPALQEDVEV